MGGSGSKRKAKTKPKRAGRVEVEAPPASPAGAEAPAGSEGAAQESAAPPPRKAAESKPAKAKTKAKTKGKTKTGKAKSAKAAKTAAALAAAAEAPLPVARSDDGGEPGGASGPAVTAAAARAKSAKAGKGRAPDKKPAKISSSKSGRKTSAAGEVDGGIAAEATSLAGPAIEADAPAGVGLGGAKASKAPKGKRPKAKAAKAAGAEAAGKPKGKSAKAKSAEGEVGPGRPGREGSAGAKAATRAGSAGRAGKTPAPRVQYGALPYRRVDAVEIMLVSSRETKRWIIPKGWPMKGRKPHEAAAREAYEEAGIEGRSDRKACGEYPYGKRMPGGAVVPCRVVVFPLAVEREHLRWPEMYERTTRWFSPEEAAAAVDEPELADLIRAFAGKLDAVRPDAGHQAGPGGGT